MKMPRKANLVLPAGHRSSPPPPPLESIIPLALRAGGILTERLHLRGELDEETTTDALLGMLFASLFWCTTVAGSQSAIRERCAWGRFRKHENRNSEETEKYSGADFALLVSKGDGDVRLALFQAKIPKPRTDPRNVGAKRPEINVHHRSKDKDGAEVGEAQMLRLARFAAKVEGAATTASPPSIKGVKWVHYLAYHSDRIAAYAFHQFKEAYEQECSGSRQTNYVDLTALSSVRLTRLLTRSVTLKHYGWHCLPIAVARLHFKLLIELMPIYFVDSDRSADLSLTNVLQSDLPTKIDLVSETLLSETMTKFSKDIGCIANAWASRPRSR